MKKKAKKPEVQYAQLTELPMHKPEHSYLRIKSKLFIFEAH